MMHVISNPRARSGRGRAAWNFWQEELHRRASAFNWQESCSGEDCRVKAGEAARKLSGQWLHQDEGCVVAVGGDGTINNVINGMLQATDPSLPPLGILYTGTSPDFCRFHGIPTDQDKALSILLARQIRRVDLGLIHLQSQVKPADNISKQCAFACSCNIGLGTATARFANTWRRYLGDKVGTALGLVLAMLRHRPFQARLRLDGNDFVFDKVNHILLIKNPHIASGLHLQLGRDPGSSLQPDDGRLLTLVIHGHSRLSLPGLLHAMYTGRLLHKIGVFARYCQSVAMSTDPVQEVEFDGDPQGYTPLAVCLLPRILPLICGSCGGMTGPGEGA